MVSEFVNELFLKLGVLLVYSPIIVLVGVPLFLSIRDALVRLDRLDRRECEYRQRMKKFESLMKK
ncbi:hypothetical protein [Borrelia sp. P9F1]|uniref:hypothetical protein n=1 Tax=Borrelia sp. P9F1 TaxID=3058374 RepID=UPI002647FD3E|nr:hypothetical protein [Borrelia sp. P9F1]WKC58516.1 hypothetical protein QYZ68_04675 [Borrelia sp. P9F1]